MHTGFLLMTCLIVLMPVSCRQGREGVGPTVILALVNGVPIREDDFRFRLALETAKYGGYDSGDGEEFRDLKRSVLDRMIENRVIIDWGSKQGIALFDKDIAHGLEGLKRGYTNKEFEMMLEEKKIPFVKWRQLAEEIILVEKISKEVLSRKATVSDREVTAYYKEHPQEFRTEERVHVRHIVTDTPEKAKVLHDRLLKGENFAKLAINHSLSPDRSNGGDLGTFTRGTHPKEFDDICFSLKPGGVSPVVKSSYGYHIFKLLDKSRPSQIPLEEVSPRIKASLLKKRAQTVRAAWLEEIKQGAQIQVLADSLEELTL